MKNKLVKSMTMIIAIAMLISMVPAVVSADTASVNIDSVVVEGDTVTVTYDAAGLSEYTLLAVRDADAYVSVSDLPTDDDDLELQIEYIDQPTLSADAENATVSFKLRDRSATELAFEGQYINVLLGGAGVATPAVAAGKELLAAPTIEADATEYFSDEDITFTVTGGTAAWAAGDVYVNGEADSTAVIAADGSSITISSEVNVTKVEVKGVDYKDATWTGSIIVKDREATAIAAVGNATVVYDVDSDSDDVLDGTAKITIPDDTTDSETGVEIAYKLAKGGVDQTLTGETNRYIVVDRPAQDSPADEYKLVATLTYNGTEYDNPVEKTVTINAIGADGYTIVADDVTLTTEAYYISGAKVATIKVPADMVEVATQTVTVALTDGTYEMYYSPERSNAEKAVFVGILRSDNADAATVAAIAEIATVTDGAEAIYYGKAFNPAQNVKIIPADVNKALSLYTANAYDSSVSDATYLVSDVSGAGRIIPMHVNNILSCYTNTPAGSATSDKSGFAIMTR